MSYSLTLPSPQRIPADLLGRAISACESVLDIFDDFTRRYGDPMPGTQGNACAFALHRIVSDFRGSMVLLDLGYLVQAASVVRPVIECFYICAIASEDEVFATEWRAGGYFTVDGLRKRAGISKDHGFKIAYQHLCEISHPRGSALHFQMTDVKDGMSTMLSGAVDRTHPLANEFTMSFLAIVFEFIDIWKRYIPAMPDKSPAGAAVLMRRYMRDVLHEVLDEAIRTHPSMQEMADEHRREIDRCALWPDAGWKPSDGLDDLAQPSEGLLP